LSRRSYVLADSSVGKTEVVGRGSAEARMYKLMRQTLAGGWSDHWVLICGVGL
jgi:hypothetical protein